LAILSSICDSEGVDYSCLDFSLLIWQKLPDDFTNIDNFCITRRIDSKVKDRLQQLIDDSVLKILSLHPSATFALSLLSEWSQPVTEMVCKSIKKFSNNEVLIGGQGLSNESWTNEMVRKGLVDCYIVGEGEISFRRYLKGDRNSPGINNYNFEQIDDLDQHCVIPNYSKLPLTQYPWLDDEPSLFITASRGCVRKCGYCDVGHLWKKYRYRNAHHVALEMITQYERHGIQQFFFTDSLINGSMKMLNELCDKLIEYKISNPHANFQWQGQYIFRPKDQVKETHIKKMADAGVKYLIVGLETGSDRVRFDMDKKHTTDDAEWSLEMFKKYGITCHLLMMGGWVTETLEDHQATLSLFSRWQKYVASKTIIGIELGSTLMILDHSPVGQRVGDLEINFINDKPYLWQSGANSELTIAERVRRRVETHYEAIKYHWPITRGLYRLNTIKNNLQEAIEHLSANSTATPRRSFEIKKEATF
jgi:hypothetical protein